MDRLRGIFNRLELIVDGVACIKISDPEVKRILVEQLDRDGNGEVNEDESINVDLRAGWFQNNQNIRTFREMKYFKGLSTTHNYTFRGSSIEDIEFSEGQTLRGGAFYDCVKLRRIVLPPDMTELNWLSNNPALEECDLPETLVSIGADCFASSKMEEVVVPPNVSSVGGGFCRNCQKLKRVVFKTNLITTLNGNFMADCPIIEALVMYTETPPATGWGSFGNTNSTMKIYVPDASVDTYKTSSGWKDRANYIYPISSYSGTL